MQLAELLMRIETELTWPTAVLENVAQLLSKTSTADRPITLTHALCRVWGRLRKSAVSSWSRAKAAHWDRAVAGSCALRADVHGDPLSPGLQRCPDPA